MIYSLYNDIGSIFIILTVYFGINFFSQRERRKNIMLTTSRIQNIITTSYTDCDDYQFRIKLYSKRPDKEGNLTLLANYKNSLIQILGSQDNYQYFVNQCTLLTDRKMKIDRNIIIYGFLTILSLLIGILLLSYNKKVTTE